MQRTNAARIRRTGRIMVSSRKEACDAVVVPILRLWRCQGKSEQQRPRARAKLSEHVEPAVLRTDNDAATGDGGRSGDGGAGVEFREFAARRGVEHVQPSV